MNTVVTCPRGHTWEPPAGQTMATPAVTCPVCGVRFPTPVAELPVSVSPSPPDATRDGAALPSHAPPTDEELVGQVLDQHSRFTLLRSHAEGGLGLVSVALDQAVGREVALKQIRPGLADDVRCRMRFLSEAGITGQLEHPGIVPVYAMGMDAAGRPFYAMKFVRGKTLGEAIDEHHKGPTALSFANLLRRFVSVCEAIAYAHSRGVIHRDLKPANIMLGEFGETLILDWGLAKRIGGEEAVGADGEAPKMDGSAVTHDGAVVGTPEYMAPEQAAGNVHLHGPAADIYSLGAVLYQILTGRPPHSGDSAAAIISSARSATAPRPSAVARGVPRAVEAICLKAMSPKAAGRYGSASELAREVERFLADERVEAHREPPWTRAGRWGRRHRVVVAGALVLLVTTLVGLAINNALVRREQGKTSAALGRAVRGEGEAVSEKERAELRLARSLVSEGRTFGLLERWTDAADRYRQGAQVLAAAGASPWAAELGLWDLYRDAPPPLNVFDGLGVPGLSAVAFSPDGRDILVAGGNSASGGILKLVDAPTGREVRTFAGHADRVTCVVFSCDGRTALSGSVDKMVKLWDVGQGKAIRTFTDIAPVRAVALSPDGRLAVSGGDGLSLKLWDMADAADTATPVKALLGHLGAVRGVAISFDGARAASASADGTCKVWTLPGGELLATYRGHIDAVNAIAFARDGRAILSGSDDKTAKLWDPQTGNTQRLLPHEEAVTSVAIAPDAPRGLAGSRGGALRVWDLSFNFAIRIYKSRLGRVEAVAYSPDTWSAIAGSAEGNVTLFDMVGAREARMMSIPGETVSAVGLSGDGRLAIYGGATHLTVRETTGGREVRVLRGQSGRATAVGISPDGRFAVAAAANANELPVWDVMTGRMLHSLKGHAGRPTAVTFSADGRFICSGAVDKTVRLWDAAGGELLHTFTGHDGPITGVALSADGGIAVSGGEDQAVRLWDVQARQPLRTLTGHAGAVRGVAISADGKLALSAGADKMIKTWDVAAGTELRTLRGHTDVVNGVAISSDGRFILSGGDDRTLRAWDAADGAELLTHRPHAGKVGGVAMSGEGFCGISFGENAAVRYDFARPAKYRELEARVDKAWTTVRANPGDAAALAAIGEWYAFRGVPRWAVDVFEQARAAGAEVNALPLAHCYWELGNHAAALKEFDRALQRKEASAAYIGLCRQAQLDLIRPPP